MSKNNAWLHKHFWSRIPPKFSGLSTFRGAVFRKRKNVLEFFGGVLFEGVSNDIFLRICFLEGVRLFEGGGCWKVKILIVFFFPGGRFSNFFRGREIFFYILSGGVQLSSRAPLEREGYLKRFACFFEWEVFWFVFMYLSPGVFFL